MRTLVFILMLLTIKLIAIAQSDAYQTSDPFYRGPGCIDLAPRYPGGYAGIQKLLSDSARYPQTPKGKYIRGSVIIHFGIDTCGNPVNISVFKGNDRNLEQEAVRLIGLLKGWRPATLNDKKVVYYLSQPFYFGAKRQKK
jgi:TonB family protein